VFTARYDVWFYLKFRLIWFVNAVTSRRAVDTGTGFLHVVRLPLLISFDQCSTSIVIYVFFLPDKRGEAMNCFRKQYTFRNQDALGRKVLLTFLHPWRVGRSSISFLSSFVFYNSYVFEEYVSMLVRSAVAYLNRIATQFLIYTQRRVTRTQSLKPFCKTPFYLLSLTVRRASKKCNKKQRRMCLN
jgi:hypothetical protein